MSEARAVQVQPASPQQVSPLQTGQGTTRIADGVVAKVAAMATQEVDGVTLGGGATRAIGGLLDNVTGGNSNATRGVAVEVGEIEAAVDLTIAVDYGKRTPEVATAVRKNVITRIESLLGLRVTEVNIQVSDIVLPQDAGRPQPGDQGQSRVQ